ncbi:hypothetical protein [Brevundimonas vancanneytii]|uniref:Uncharacterized protein n=1 Tax=Brevundimonas vancanneytii TaxID=1325724 RepID=A0A4P1KH45_9CAUL|nr:hypothetical protein [Brevundimonas vancanneytii]VTO19768.1 Uncharacterised protein [Brevundimonas vancanneytii]
MMNKLLVLLILGVVLAVLRAMAVGLAALLLLTLIGSFIARPKKTLAFLGTLGLSALAVAQPLACIVALAVVGIVIVVSGRRRSPAPRKQLDHPH